MMSLSSRLNRPHLKTVNLKERLVINMKTTIFERVRTIIVEELRVSPDKVQLESTLRGQDLQADSLHLVSLVMAFAQEFGVEVQDREFRQVVTVGDVVAYIERNLQPQLA